MKLDRTKNTLRNTFWGFIQQIIQIILPFFTRTLLIKLLGADYLGLNSLFSSILQVLNLAEAGFSTAIVFSMYKPIAEDDQETIYALLALYRKIYRFIGLAITIIGLALLPFLPYLINGDYPADVNIAVLYCLYLANSAVSYLLFAYKTSLFSAFQRNDAISKIASVLSIVQPLTQIIVLLFYRNLIAYTIIIPCVTVIKNISIAVLAKKQFPQYTCTGTVAKDIRRDIYKRVFGLFIGKLSQTTRDSFDNIFISTFIGLTTVTIYSNYFYIMTAVHGFLQIIITSMSAGLGNSVASESTAKNHTLFSTISFLYATLSGWCTVCLICLYQPFMQVWVGESLLFPFSTMLILSVYFYLLTMGDVKGIFSGSAGLWWEERYRALIEAGANIILNYVFVKKWGIFGIIFATVLTLLFINFGYGSSILFKYYFKSKKQLILFYGTHLTYICITGGIAALTYSLCNFFFPTATVITFLARLVICLTVPTALYCAIYFKRFQEKEVKTLMHKIIKR